MNQAYMHNFLKGIEIRDKSVLDVGCGDGTLAKYALKIGAKSAVGIDPRLPEIYGWLLNFNYHEGNLSLFPQTFQNYITEDKYDVVILHDSINHLDEEACIKLHRSSWAAKIRYITLLQKLYAMTNHGGKVVIADASRHNFFPDMGLKNPFDKTIEWYKHQNPEVWVLLLKHVGFVKPQINWLTPQRLLFADKYLSNKVASYFLVSHFRLIMSKE